MSRFSGKCDFYDDIEIWGLDFILNSDVYVGQSQEPLHLTCLADCIPYYPYVVSAADYNKEQSRGLIRLTEKSWVDIEEEKYGPRPIHAFYRQSLQEEIERHKT